MRGQELPTAYVRAKFEGRSFIRLRNIGTFPCGALIDPVALTFDLLTLKSVWESHVTWGTPVQSFVFLGLLVFELEPMYATSDRQTDGRTDDGRRSSLNAPAPPPLRGGGIISHSAPLTQLPVTHVSQASPVYPVRHVHFPLPNTPSWHTPCPEQLPASPGHSDTTTTWLNFNITVDANKTYVDNLLGHTD